MHQQKVVPLCSCQIYKPYLCFAFIAPDFPPLLPAETVVGSRRPHVNEISISLGAIAPWTRLICWGEEEWVFKESKGCLKTCLVCLFQDCWRYGTQQEHPRVCQCSDPEELCKKQMESKWPILRGDAWTHNSATAASAQPSQHVNALNRKLLLWPKILNIIVGPILDHMALLLIERATSMHKYNEYEGWGQD